MYKLLVVGVLLGACGGALSHTYHLGPCPVVESMPGFEMNKLLGVWYVIQKTATMSRCITYNFTKTVEPGMYQVEQISQQFILGLMPLQHEYKYTGKLFVPNWSDQAKMTVKFPLSVGPASYTVLATDYKSYAAIFTCQNLSFIHRRSATILSRSHDLEQMYVDEIHNKLSSYGVDPNDLSIISQKNCPRHVEANGEGVNINIGLGMSNTGRVIVGINR